MIFYYKLDSMGFFLLHNIYNFNFYKENIINNGDINHYNSSDTGRI